MREERLVELNFGNNEYEIIVKQLGEKWVEILTTGAGTDTQYCHQPYTVAQSSPSITDTVLLAAISVTLAVLSHNHLTPITDTVLPAVISVKLILNSTVTQSSHLITDTVLTAAISVTLILTVLSHNHLTPSPTQCCQLPSV